MSNFLNKFTLAEDFDEQEHLSPARLKQLTTVDASWTNAALTARPRSSFIDLMNWTQDNFGHALNLKKDHKLVKFVHNRFIIDGQFLHYCDLNNIKVTCLYNDAIISWRSDGGTEKFFAQGVFKIECANFSFLHAALFHKGNQNEDEVSFFVLVPEKSSEKYTTLRNDFDDWLRERDRSNAHIRVIEGEDIPYDVDATWDRVFLPLELKREIKDSIETFLSSKDFYESAQLPWKRGILLYGDPGNGKTSLIRTIISTYNFKPVTISPGAGDNALREAFSYAESQSPALLYFEDLDSMFQNINVSLFLNLLDGLSTKNGLLIVATANTLENFHSNITDRPSRFDRKYEIPSPDKTMALKYLKQWFGKVLSDAKLKELAQIAVKYSFSYAYLKDLYITSMFNAISKNRKAPLASDINTALKQIIAEKSLGKGSRKITGLDRYVAEKI